ncbi:MAG: NIPSNAP family protein [Chloroflexi bacterium]|nr:NIPSNAP family protein [Chloroflexota bacterium]
MIYELRVYDAVPGKMPALLDRFRRHTMKLFERHNIRCVGFWTDDVGQSNRLTYICMYDSPDARQTAWDAFRADPDWKAAVAESEANGPLVVRVLSTLMRPTDFSALQ